MLNVFKKNKDNDAIRMYRTAFIKEDSGDRIVFRYQLVDRETIAKEQFLKGVEMQSHTLVIKTYSSYEFNVKTKIIIGTTQYTVDNIYTEQQPCNDGMFRVVKQYKYLTLVK